MKTALLQQILTIVASVCEISENEIISHAKSSDIVDARIIFVFYCAMYGFPAATIAKFLNRKRVCTIRDCLRNYKIFSAQSTAFRLLSAEVCKKLSAIFPATER